MLILSCLVISIALIHGFHTKIKSFRQNCLKMSFDVKTVAILGASGSISHDTTYIINIHESLYDDKGYTGTELVRLLSSHSQIKIKILTGDRSSGQEFKTIFPQYAYRNDLPTLTNWETSQNDIEKCDVAFCCLPHGTTQQIISILSKTPSLKVFLVSFAL